MLYCIVTHCYRLLHCPRFNMNWFHIWEKVRETREICFVDADGDGYRLTDTVVSADAACDGPGEARAAAPTGDCNDGDSSVRPGAAEICNGEDDDCDGTPDDGLATVDYYADGDGDGFGPEEGGDAIGMDDTAEMEPGMMEAISLKAAPKPVTSEEGGVNKKSTYAANSGQAGMASRPVHTGASEGGRHDTAAYSNNTKELIGKVGNTPAQSTQGLKPATKPHLGQASGVNTKSPLPSGRKG